MSKGMFTAWSYSRMRDYDKCPLFADFKHIQKLKEPENEAMARGTMVHGVVQEYLEGKLPATDPIPGWTYFAEQFQQLRELNPQVEQEWGFTQTWGPTGWFGRDTWFRSKLDVCVIYEEDGEADVIDVKTGKPDLSETPKQGELYALSVFQRYKFVQRVTVRFWYVDAHVQMPNKQRETVYRYSRDMAPDMLQRWTKKAQRMLADAIRAPRPGQHCRWCYQSKSNNGLCKYG